MSPPEFSIICRTHGGPATSVYWFPPDEIIDYVSSQLIVDTSYNTTYENQMSMRGNHSGIYYCRIENNIRDYFPTESYLVSQSIRITGMIIIIVYESLFSTDMYSCW